MRGGFRSSLFRDGFVYEGTWAGIPAANTVRAGDRAWVSDIGTAGSVWISDGTTRWYPLGGTVNLYTLAAPVTGIGSAETVAGQYLMPVNLLQVGDSLRFWLGCGKSGTTDTGTFQIRVGTAGTTADTVITGITGAQIVAANRSAGWIYGLFLASATSLVKKGIGNAALGSYTGAGATAVAATTITSAAANALYVSVTAKSSGSTDTVSVEECLIQLVSKA